MDEINWEELFDILENDYGGKSNLEFIINSKLPEERPLFALKLSVAKWHPDNPNRGGGSCGLCCYYPYNCTGCPLCDIEQTCNKTGSLYQSWYTNKTKENADKMYEVLLDLLKKELSK